MKFIKIASVLLLIVLLTGCESRESAPISGTFTVEQVAEGHIVFNEMCSSCRGSNLEGGIAPTLTGTMFQKTWSRENVNVDDLHYIVTTSMPPQQTNLLDEEDYLAVLAYILDQNGVPAGQNSLTNNREQLSGIRMVSGDINIDVPSFIEGEHGLQPTGRGPTSTDLVDASENPENRLYHTGNYEGTRYSALSQINKTNVSELRPVCIYQLGDPGNFQTGPIVHDGTMYITGPHTTAAIDAKTCRPLWRHIWEPRDREV